MPEMQKTVLVLGSSAIKKYVEIALHKLSCVENSYMHARTHTVASFSVECVRVRLENDMALKFY